MRLNNSVKTADNGVNVEALLGARTMLAGMPEAAQFTWRASCEWLGGVHSQSTITGFFGLGEERSHKLPHLIEADHPAEFAAPDAAPTPVEIVLSALASCLTGGVASVAQNRGVQLHSVKSTVEGDMNLLGILGADPDVRNGFSAIRVHFDIEADASKEEIASIVAQSQRRSAVFDLITNPSNVRVTLN